MLLLFRSSVPEELTGPEGSPQVTEGGAGPRAALAEVCFADLHNII